MTKYTVTYVLTFHVLWIIPVIEHGFPPVRLLRALLFIAR